jgi:TolB-like protein/Tfp pilus assembly protein PilF/predicted Ser/Thr protein kinase
VRDTGSLVGRRLTHYLVERRIGEGGMGEVYLARDLALGRNAALKVLRPDLAGDLPERLRREAHAFARLQHPWIATFYEADEADGVSFLAMEYVAGETLRERLRQGPLRPEHALAVASCLLEALAHAHAAGILHRDLKPENVVAVGSDAAKLLDFGIAARWSDGAAGVLPGATLTEWGDSTAGTAGYSAPEQLRGLPVDARADIFSAGAVLYEAATGRPAFPGANAAERLAAILGGTVAPPSASGLPSEWDLVLKRCLARDPAERYPTAAAFLSDVRRLRGGDSASALPDTIAVMDFANLSGEAGDAWISSGVAESVSADLARIPGIRVLSRERALRARAAAGPGAEPDPLAMGHALGCRWILSGGIQRLGPALRITARLTEVPTGLVAASEKLDGAMETIFAMQDRLAEAVAARLAPRAPDVAATPAGPEPTVRAYELYARAKRLADRLEKGTFDQAQELFEETIAIEPRHAPALAGLAKVHAMKFTYTTDPSELELATAYARRSIEADPSLGEPHSWLAYALFRQQRYDEAVAEGERASALEATGSYGTYFAACACAAAADVARAVGFFQRTVETDPQHGFAWLGLGWCHLTLENSEEAVWCFRRVVALEGTGGAGPTAGAGGALAEALRLRGDLAGAREAALAALASADRSDHMYRDTFRGISLASLGRTSLAMGDPDAARAAYGQLVAHVKGRPRALGAGHLMVQALAGLARASGNPADLDRAVALAEGREGYDFSWSWSCSEDQTAADVAEACRALGRDPPRGKRP